MDNSTLFRKALDRSGYNHMPATEQAIQECFLDYVDAGIWQDLSITDREELYLIPPVQMAMALYRT